MSNADKQLPSFWQTYLVASCERAVFNQSDCGEVRLDTTCTQIRFANMDLSEVTQWQRILRPLSPNRKAVFCAVQRCGRWSQVKSIDTKTLIPTLMDVHGGLPTIHQAFSQPALFVFKADNRQVDTGGTGLNMRYFDIQPPVCLSVNNRGQEHLPVSTIAPKP